jgi:hypothetical protein
MKWLGRLGAAFLLSAALFAGAPLAQAQQAQPGQLAPCPLVKDAKIITATSYRVTTADRCQFVTFTSSSTISIELPAPSLIFQPGFEVRLVPTNGGTLTFTNLQDDAGVKHKINLGTTLTLTAGTGAELMILQDMNWWAAMLGGASKGTVTSVDLSMPSGFTVTGGPITDAGTLAVSAASMTSHVFAAGPINGVAPWTWRAIDATDLPAGSCNGLTNAGSACQANTGTSGATVGLLNGNNTYSGSSTFDGSLAINGNSSFNANISMGSITLNSNATNFFNGETNFQTVLFKVTTDSTTARTLARADCGTQIDFTNGSTITVTIPNSLPIGCGISLRQGGLGQVQPAAGSGATLRTPHGFVGTSAQYAIIGINVAENSGGSAAIADFVGDGQ